MNTEITALILTFNEKENVARTMAALFWAKEVLLVDSGSTDGTIELAHATHPNLVVFERAFDTFADQCNFGLEHVKTEWVLSIDADYVVTPELAEEISRLDPEDEVTGYTVSFRYCVHGRPLRDTLYPPRTVLYRREKAFYVNEGHGHRVKIEGRIIPLIGKIDHDDRKPLTRWIAAQDRYAGIEAAHLLKTPWASLNFQDQLRCRVFITPWLMPLYLLFARRLIFDGWPGWYYVLQRTIAEMLLSLRLLTVSHSLEGRQGPSELR